MQYHVFEWPARRSRASRFDRVVLFKHDTKYFGPGDSAFMLNYRVDDLDAMITKLQAEGVEVGPDREVDENGRFAGITDPGVGAPDGAGAPSHRIQLWEPAPGR